MIRYQGFVFELKPNNVEKTLLRRFAGCSRFVWNEVLALNELRFEYGEKIMNYHDAANYLKFLKSEHAWLNGVHSQPLQQTLMDLWKAYTNFFNPELAAEKPQFKKKFGRSGIRFPQGFKVANKAIYLPKIGWIPYIQSRKILGQPKSVTVSQRAEKWFVSILTEREVEEPSHSGKSTVGIDLGVKIFAALSTGEKIFGPNSFEKLGRKLAHLNRELSRRVKFSKNWRKTKQKISCLHFRIANTRKDALHKTSTAISKNHAIVFIEDLRIKNMTKSASGTIENPGTNVAQKRGLNRRILDQGWGMFGEQLAYKCYWNGGLLVRVNPRDTSRECSECHFVAKESRKTQSLFVCIACGFEKNADINAANTIEYRGLRLLSGRDTSEVPVERSSNAVKQETRSNRKIA